MELAAKEVTPRDLQHVIEMAQSQMPTDQHETFTSYLSNIVWMRRVGSPIRLEKRERS